MLVESGDVDTVLLAITDMQGRLQGKRLDARYFMDDVLAHGTEGCNYLLAVDVDMNTVDGYAMSSWDTRLRRLRDAARPGHAAPVPWQPGTVLLSPTCVWEDGSDVVGVPRQILQRQTARLAERGWRLSSAPSWSSSSSTTPTSGMGERLPRPHPANQYNVDYSVLGTARIEPLLRRIRHGMAGAGMQVESAKGECNLGQHEIAFKYADALATCDNHVIYKNGAKEIAAQAGSGAHVHGEVRRARGQLLPHPPVASADDGRRARCSRRRRAGTACRALGRVVRRRAARAHAGADAALRAEHQLLQAVRRRARSRRRRSSGGADNRTCAFRLVGHGAGAAAGEPGARRRREPLPRRRRR